MREFDTNGLIVCEFQAELFEKSYMFFEGSSIIFFKRFLNSDISDILDENESSLISFSIEEVFDFFDDDFQKSKKGKDKLSPNILYFIGYVYRYISYTRDISTRLLFKLIPYELIKDSYFSLHTQDLENVVSNLLELAGYNENILDKNYRFKEALYNLK